LLGLTGSRIARLSNRIRDGREFTVTIPERRVHPHRRWRVCLLVSEGDEIQWETDEPLVVADGTLSVIAIARLRGSGRPTTTDNRVTVAGHWIVDPPLPLEELVDHAWETDEVGLQRAVDDLVVELEGPHSDSAIRALLELRPSLADVIDRLSRFQDPELVVGQEGENLALERDAVHVALSIAGFDVDDAETWNGDIAGGYLSRLAYEPREEVLSGYDASRFPDWSPMPSSRADWTIFTDGRHHMRVGNVNATKLERILGVDLIYRHLDTDTFVLVQYKKMIPDPKGGFSYRPDKQLYDEIARMRKVDSTANIATANPGTWRLYPQGCFVKLVRPPKHFDPTSDRLLSGIYLPVPYLDELLTDSNARGMGHRPRLGFGTVDRYLTTGLFASLVREGWIGTRGVATRAIERLVEAAVGSERSVVVAEEAGNVTGKERRRNRPRESN
jgi:hypothetical protein